jgi:hypothetical protein
LFDELFELVFEDWLPAWAALAVTAAAAKRMIWLRIAFTFGAVASESTRAAEPSMNERFRPGGPSPPVAAKRQLVGSTTGATS